MEWGAYSPVFVKGQKWVGSDVVPYSVHQCKESSNIKTAHPNVGQCR